MGDVGSTRDRGGTEQAVRVRPGVTALRIGVGSPYRRPGRVQVEVRTDGTVRVSTIHKSGIVSDEGRIDASRASTLLEAASRAIAEAARLPPLPGTDCEPVYWIALVSGDEPVAGVLRAEREVEVTPGLRCLVAALRGLIREVAGDRHLL